MTQASDAEDDPGPPPDTAEAIVGCRAAHARLLAALDGLDDTTVARASRLPGWTIGHVVTHLARNADSHVRLIDGALAGEVTDQYEGGSEGRAADIDAGAARPASELLTDLAAAIDRLEEAWGRTTHEVWMHGDGRTSRTGVQPVADLPFRRWREVEVHQADMGLDFGPDDWPTAYVDVELPRVLAGLPGRLSAADRRRLLAWVIGRGDPPVLPPW